MTKIENFNPVKLKNQHAIDHTEKFTSLAKIQKIFIPNIKVSKTFSKKKSSYSNRKEGKYIQKISQAIRRKPKKIDKNPNKNIPMR